VVKNSSDTVLHASIKMAFKLFEAKIKEKEKEEALQESEEQYRTLFTTSSAAIAIFEPDATISMVNEEYCRLSGYTKEEVVGMRWTQQIPPEDLERLKEYNRKRLINPNDAPAKYELSFIHKSGEIRHAVISLTMLSNQKIIASFIDITERKRAQETLMESEEKFSVAFKTSPYAITITRLKDGLFIEVNDAFYAMTGFTREETENNASIGMGLWVDGEDRNRVVEELLGGGEVVEREFRFKKKNGEILTGLYSAHLIQIKNDTAILSSIDNVTARKQAEVYREMGREILQILTTPGDIQDSIQRVLAVLKSRTGFEAVGIRLQDGDDFPYFVQEGFTKDFLRTENTLIERGGDGGVCLDGHGNVSLECTCGLVISGKTDPKNPYFTHGGSC
jgi:PAS domain S-box-containing protein